MLAIFKKVTNPGIANQILACKLKFTTHQLLFALIFAIVTTYSIQLSQVVITANLDGPTYEA